jgi:hypothetical protein
LSSPTSSRQSPFGDESPFSSNDCAGDHWCWRASAFTLRYGEAVGDGGDVEVTIEANVVVVVAAPVELCDLRWV